MHVTLCKKESQFCETHNQTTAFKNICEDVLRADQIPVLQCMPCAYTGPLQVSSLCRGPGVFQVGCRACKIHIQLSGDAGLQIRSV